MFFYKGKKNTDTKLGKVVIIGTSPLAFVLADVIQNNDYDVSILTSKLEKQTFITTTSLFNIPDELLKEAKIIKL